MTMATSGDGCISENSGFFQKNPAPPDVITDVSDLPHKFAVAGAARHCPECVRTKRGHYGYFGVLRRCRDISTIVIDKDVVSHAEPRLAGSLRRSRTRHHLLSYTVWQKGGDQRVLGACCGGWRWRRPEPVHLHFENDCSSISTSRHHPLRKNIWPCCRLLPAD